MNSKISFKRILFIVSIVGTIFFSIIITFGLSGQSFYIKPVSTTNNQIPQKINSQLPTSLKIPKINSQLPTSLKIPKININVDIEYMGLNSSGAMDISKNLNSVTWFKLGPSPGEIGSAVIAGHYGVWKNGKISVFNNLYKLHKGDKLYIENNNGTIITFIVRDIQTYKQSESVPDIFSSNDGKSHLNLITCQGNWNKISKSYPYRLVVFTDKEM